jgi:hypothetical protein
MEHNQYGVADEHPSADVERNRVFPGVSTQTLLIIGVILVCVCILLSVILGLFFVGNRKADAIPVSTLSFVTASPVGGITSTITSTIPTLVPTATQTLVPAAANTAAPAAPPTPLVVVVVVTPIPTAGVILGSTLEGVVTTSRMDVYTGPNTAVYPHSGFILKSPYKVLVVCQLEGWAKIKYTSPVKEGWVNAAYLRTSSPVRECTHADMPPPVFVATPTSTPVIVTPQPSDPYIKVNVNGQLPVFAGPGPGYGGPISFLSGPPNPPAIARVFARADVLGRRWWKIDTSAGPGWVDGGYVIAFNVNNVVYENPPPTFTPVPPTNTPTVTSTPTPGPTATSTSTLIPTLTFTPVPPTNTSTATVVAPTATNTLVPVIPTDTPTTTPTATLVPLSPTATLTPTATVTLVPGPSSTPY